jgi:hypothetical protein
MMVKLDCNKKLINSVKKKEKKIILTNLKKMSVAEILKPISIHKTTLQN